MDWNYPWSWFVRLPQPGRSKKKSAIFQPRFDLLEDRCLLSIITVTTAADNVAPPPPGSLRAALGIAAPGDTIQFAPELTGQTIILQGALPAITQQLTISGSGVHNVAISGDDNYPVFTIFPGGTVTISELTLRNGHAPHGGEIYNLGTVNLSDLTIINGSTFDTGGGGGGIFNSGTLTLLDSTVANNTTNGNGGAIFNAGGMAITNSTLTENSAVAGGGIANAGTLTLLNDTIAGNNTVVGGFGGGMYLSAGYSVNMRNTLVAENTATNGPDILGAVTLADHNLLGNNTGSSGIVNGVNGNQVGTESSPIDPRIGVLQNNGGWTSTMALQPGSPAIDAGTNVGIPETDQRGYRRTVNGIADIGAYEYQPPETITLLVSAPNASTVNQPVAFTATVNPVAPDSNTPTGTVTLSNGSTVMATLPLNNGRVTYVTAALPAGSYSITARYSGDALFSISTSSPLTQVVNRGDTLTLLASTPNPSTVGHPVTLSALVSPLSLGSIMPSGTVTFFADGQFLGTTGLNSSYTAVLTAPSLHVGTCILTATYNGDSNFLISTSDPRNQLVNQAATITQLDSSLAVSTVGQQITFTATVNPTETNSLTPSGTVSFVDGTTPLGTVALDGRTASYSTRALAGGAHVITATYNGDGNFRTSNSNPRTLLVNPAEVTVSLRSSLNPARIDRTVTFTATVTPTSYAPFSPTGTVTFLDGLGALGTVPLNGTSASLSTSTMVVGRHSISARYNGDTNFVSFTSISLPQIISAQGIFAIGGTPGRVQVRRVTDGSLITEFAPYGPTYGGAVSVAIGDVNGDGYPDLVTGALAGNPHVKVFDGRALALGTFNPFNPDASLLAQFFAYALQFNVGANVAVGDISGNGYADIVTGASAGNPHVKVYSGRDIALGTFHPDGSSLLAQFFPYALQFNVGANIAVGDIDADGYADIVTGATVGNPHVKVYSGRAIATGTFSTSDPDASMMAQFFAYQLQFNVGVFVAVGDTEGDGYGNIITGASVGNPHVRVISGRAIANHTFDNSHLDNSQLDQFFAYDLQYNVGVAVGAGDFLGNGRASILTGATRGAPHYRVVDGHASGVRPPALNDMEGIPDSFRGGINVGA